MIFLSVGSKYPFDRLVEQVDEWAGRHRQWRVFGQIGETSFRPKNIDYRASLTVEEFRRRVRDCTHMISHAGMGNLITALEFHRPILLVPRFCALGEAVNDHQVSTARHFGKALGIQWIQEGIPAGSEVDWAEAIESGLRTFLAGRNAGETAKDVSEALLRRISGFIEAPSPRGR